jgi:S1-C subfamily serine protease
VISAAASDGSSGGPLLNERGEVLGLVYTLIGDQREQGTRTPTWARDSDAVVVLLDEQTRRQISAAQ